PALVLWVDRRLERPLPGRGIPDLRFQHGVSRGAGLVAADAEDLAIRQDHQIMVAAAGLLLWRSALHVAGHEPLGAVGVSEVHNPGALPAVAAAAARHDLAGLVHDGRAVAGGSRRSGCGP